MLLTACGVHNAYQGRSVSSYKKSEKAATQSELKFEQISTDPISVATIKDTGMFGMEGLSVIDPNSENLPIDDSEDVLNQYDQQIGPSDLLRVNVFQVEELSKKEVRVGNNGMLSLPLVGSIKIEGLTAKELESEITEILGEKYLQDPHVSVSIIEHISKRFTVAGEVKKPGLYPIQGSTTLLEAISIAEGEEYYGDLSQVGLIRTVAGSKKINIYNVNAIRDQKEVDPEIHANDVIVVNKDGGKAVWRKVTRFFGVFLNPSGNIFR
ncbi:polysaccharide biosynthesis/export family protein [Candidatus Nitrosacidococcus sp. I8]|uniref:polysaccharide biosynthesis/export family protein n=1 Tax=Candidatus Nitrosacidococcus sp. I8 TaxID=2942908 RepID=UPI0022264160|nr:polysaccharide biosynthesis/export family protein [Candidatus Nitrosacidococcus sp. I8]CAH9018358.1 hypothetical protein NURINAE_00879 [Candidatus Nitrosacidococcus sp. I8]